ncbi:MAG: CdaR family protein [Chloroflexi bacterium]|nr:CdaR family protein [Chloroflexota bacterium]
MIRRWAQTNAAGNFLWLTVSLLLATGVWYIAVTSADPIQQRRFSSVPILFVESDSAVMTSSSARTAIVTVQGSQASIPRLVEEIEVRAELSRLGPGTHTVPLHVSVAPNTSDSIRRPVLRIQPAQILVELEPIESRDMAIEIAITDPPPTGYRHDEPQLDIDDVVVRGAASRMSQVAAIRGELDLSASRSPLEQEVRLHAEDAEGDRVNGVELSPQSARVAVRVSRRDDIRQFPVRPNILLHTLTEGFLFKDYSYDPASLFISGAPEQLAQLSDTLLTERISLEGHQEKFEATVPILLPDDDLFVMGGNNNITVTVDIIPIIVSRQIDSIEVDHFGLDGGFAVTIAPRTVSAIVNGPVVLVEPLSAADVQVNVDLDGLVPGVYDLAPSIAINRGELSEANVSLSPSVLNVEITPLASQR